MDDALTRPLGAMLVESGLITAEELADALAEQERDGRPLGEILVDRGCISRPALTRHLVEQWGVELVTQEGFGYGLWGELERRHERFRPPERRTGNDRRTGDRRSGEDRRAAAAAAEPSPDPNVERLRFEMSSLESSVDAVERWVQELELALERATEQLGSLRESLSDARGQLGG